MGTPSRKPAGALPAAQRETATSVRERLLVGRNRWGRVEQPTAIPVQIRRAVERQNRMRLVSRDRTGSVTERLVDPLGVVAKAGIW